MPRLRAAGYKYAALPDIVGQKSAQELEREELEATWKQKTAEMWANAELEVPRAQARRVQQRERNASRAVTVPLPPRAGATSPTRERRKITTASPSKDGRRAATETPPQGKQLEGRANQAPSSGEGRSPARDTVTAVQQQPTAVKVWKQTNTAARTVLTEQVPSKTMETMAVNKLKKKKQAGAKRPASNDKTEEPTSQLMLHEISVGRLGSGGVGRLSNGRPSRVQEQPGGSEDVVNSDSEPDSEPESELDNIDGGDFRESGAQVAGGRRPETQIVAPSRRFSDLERQFRTVEASLPAAEREVLADDLRNIAGAISSMSLLQQSTTDDGHVAVSARAAQVQRPVGGVQDNDGCSANHGIDESQQSWSQSSDEDRDDVREYEPAQRRSESQWKLHTDVATGEQFEIHSITQEVRWLGAEADKSEPTVRHTKAINKGGLPSARKPVNTSRGRRRSSNTQMPTKPQRILAARHSHHRQAERSLTRKTSKPPGSQTELVREGSGAGEAKALRRMKSHPHQSAAHDSGRGLVVATAQERKVRLKAERRKEQEVRRPVSAESELDSSDDDDDDDGYSDPDRKSPRSVDKEGYDSGSSSDNSGRKAAQGRGNRSKRAQTRQVTNDRREKVSSRPVEEFDLREPGYRRAGRRRRSSRDGIFETTMGFGDEPESLIALEEKWQVYLFRSLRF